MAPLPFLTFALPTDINDTQLGMKASAEHERGIVHAGSLAQSPSTPTKHVSLYTVSSFRSIVRTRRSPHDTTLSCVPLDKDMDAVALHDCSSTEGFSRAWATC